MFGNPPDHCQPKRVYLEVIAGLRQLWQFQTERSNTSDQTNILAIDAIRSLLALLTWPQLLVDRPWVHFIDNSSAQAALIKGSSNSLHDGCSWKVGPGAKGLLLAMVINGVK